MRVILSTLLIIGLTSICWSAEIIQNVNVYNGKVAEVLTLNATIGTANVRLTSATNGILRIPNFATTDNIFIRLNATASITAYLEKAKPGVGIWIPVVIGDEINLVSDGSEDGSTSAYIIGNKKGFN